jgi:H+/Cl- antiporter ClcA
MLNLIGNFLKNLLKKFTDEIVRHTDIDRSKLILSISVWISAGLVGLIAVGYNKLIAFFQKIYFSLFHQYEIYIAISGPLLFVLATWLVKRFAPHAKGSGIPQVLSAIEESKINLEEHHSWDNYLVSMRTAIIKVISSSVGILGGASIGREGPTIQIAASIFTFIGKKFKRFTPQIEFRTFLIAGSAAGVAAAFNTPIAGVTFALEELGGNFMGPLRQMVMLAIIIGGIIAQALEGNYLYFGHPVIQSINFFTIITETLLIGFIGGLFGGAFAKILGEPHITKLPKHWILRAFIAGMICAIIGYFTHGLTAGSGYEVTMNSFNSGNYQELNLLYPVYKFATTVFSYLSGMAGGIFSPSLSIGAGIGSSIGKILSWPNLNTCALLGMVAFFSGAVRAPLTAVVIVTEMTDEHSLVLPFMIVAFLANSISKRVMKEPLYHYLAKKHFEG